MKKDQWSTVSNAVITSVAGPGAGKDTLTKSVSSFLKKNCVGPVKTLGMSDVLRARATEKPDSISSLIIDYMKKGDMVPDYVIDDAIGSFVDSLSGKELIVLAGFPRTPEQTKLFIKLFSRFRIFVTEINVTADEMFQRQVKRAMEEERLDNDPEIMQKRITEYFLDFRDPVVNIYRQSGIEVIPINGMQPPLAVFRDTMFALADRLKTPAEKCHVEHAIPSRLSLELA